MDRRPSTPMLLSALGVTLSVMFGCEQAQRTSSNESEDQLAGALTQVDAEQDQASSAKPSAEDSPASERIQPEDAVPEVVASGEDTPDEPNADAHGADTPAGDTIDASNLLPVELPGMRFWPGRGWVRQETDSAMRAAQFRLPLEDWDTTERETDAQLVVYYFGEQGAGTTQANVDRWLGQFEPAGDKLDASVEREDFFGLTGTLIRVQGTYVAETRPGSGQRHNEPNWAMVGAIVDTDAGPYYVRFLGPRATLEEHDIAITHMLDSIEPN